MSELKPCPFCGELPTKHRKYSEVDCRVWLCPLQSIVVPISQWNTRPIEDQLRAELEKLGEAYDQMQEDWMHTEDNNDQLHNAIGCAIYELKEGNPNLAREILEEVYTVEDGE